MKNITTIAIASDHAGYKMKEFLKDYLNKKGIEILDFGTFSDESADYPDFAHPLAECIESGKASIGISLCGSGNGITMTVNKHQKIRAALCWNAEIAELSVQHNNANICSLPARYISETEAKILLILFLVANLRGGDTNEELIKYLFK